MHFFDQEEISLAWVLAKTAFASSSGLNMFGFMPIFIEFRFAISQSQMKGI